MHPWFNSLRQLVKCLTHGLTEVFQFLPVHPPVKGFTYICTGYPELDKVGSVGQSVLVTCEPGIGRRGGGQTYLDRGKNKGNSAKNCSGWCGVRDILREVHGVDGHIQRGDGIIFALDTRIHGRNSR